MATILSASAPAFEPGHARVSAPGGGSPGPARAATANTANTGPARGKSGKQKRGRGHKQSRGGGSGGGSGRGGAGGSGSGGRNRNHGGASHPSAGGQRYRPPAPPASSGFLSRGSTQPTAAAPPAAPGGRAGPSGDRTPRNDAPAARSNAGAGAGRRGSRGGHRPAHGGASAPGGGAPAAHGERGDRQQQQQQRGGRGQQRGKPRGRGPASAGGKGRNTESFKPCFDAPDMRLVVGYAGDRTYPRPYSVHDVLLVPDLFCRRDDTSVYASLLAELRAAGSDSLFTLWHGDSHLIADDKRMRGAWKAASPSFQRVVARMEEYFGMHIEATRFNHYRDQKDWKPYHHDAAAVKPRFAKIQNITVAASFGAEREVGFLHAATGAVIAAPQPNGSCYAFGRDVNMEWKHGVLPVRDAHAAPAKGAALTAPGGGGDEPATDAAETGNAVQGRVSIIAWGWVDQTVAESRIRTTP